MASDPRMQLTDEQQRALAAHDRSVSLAAGAGCGKTFVLTERFLSYLDPGQLEPTAELTELVAITFTDAAAREMRDRIRRRCRQRLQQADNATHRSAWKRLLTSLDGARISTIHSFCATLLRNYAAEAALDPRFELLDPATADLLRLQSLDHHLRHLLVAADERLIQLATHFGLGTLRNSVAALLGNNVQQRIERWKHATPAELAAHWRDYYETEAAPAASARLLSSEPVQALRTICATTGPPQEKLQAHFQATLTLLETFSQSEAPHLAAGQLRRLARVQGVCTKKDWDDPSEFEAFKQTCTAVRGLIDKSLLRAPLAEDGLHQVAAIGLDLLQLVAEVDQRYTRAKQHRNALEFDDLLSHTHALLVDDRYPQVRQSLTRNTRLLMVDEFQDTDPLQVAIVKALRGDDWAAAGLFVVGDFKQSIYRFRGAEPRVSSELRATLPEQSQLSLTTNFRSQPAIVHFVNALFHDTFTERYEPLVAHRPQLTPTPAVEFLWSGPDDELTESRSARHRGQTEMARRQEARFIARRLAQLLDSSEPLVVDTETAELPAARPLRLGDIAILLRTLSDVSLYEAALREYGLDYYLAGGHAFYAQQEIYDILHLLRSIASPLDELSLAGLLRSPMFACADETLFWLTEQAGSLNGGLFGEALPEQLSTTERAKALRAATTLGQLRRQKDQLLVAELMQEAIGATGYDAILLAEFLGERKWANVQKLIEQARSLDRTRPGDLNGFVTQLSEFVVRAPKEPLAATRADGEVIRIMTIHYAKGLEFPLVVVPDLNRPNFPGSRQPVFDQQLGPLVPESEKQEIVGWDLHRFVEQQQEQEERQRLLYVACTRAADYLLLSSSVADLDGPQSKWPKSDWLKLLGEHFDLADGTCLTRLPTGCEVPEVRVTASEPATSRQPAGPSRGVDLQKMIEKTDQLAAAGQGAVPAEVAPIPVHLGARQRFSFSKLSGELLRAAPAGSEQSSLENRAVPAAGDADDAPDAGRAVADGRAFGTLVHAVLERVDFRQPTTDLVGLCEFLAPQHFTNNWAAAVAEAADLIGRFLNSPRAAELADAKQLLREVEFLLPWPLDQSPYRGRYLQGYIDCLYQSKSGDWHLLDYKSNRVDPSGVSQAAEQYKLQMFVYGFAAQRALGVAPVECVLHFLRPGIETEGRWQDSERLEMTGLIDQAIDAQLRC